MLVLVAYQVSALRIRSSCTTSLAAPPLREECCKCVGQTFGEQCVITATAVLKGEQPVNNLDMVAANYVSMIIVVK